MKRVLTMVALTVLGLAGCGGGLKTTFVPVAPVVPTPDVGASISTVKLADIAGNYTIDSVTFETDLAKDMPSAVNLTHTLQTLTTSVDGNPQNIQVRLDKTYLIITPSGVFSFYYSIVNAKGELVKVGSFQAGSMSGKVKFDVTGIGFVAGGTNGLADEQEMLYEGVQYDGKTLTLRDTTTGKFKDTPTPHFSIVKAAKE